MEFAPSQLKPAALPFLVVIGPLSSTMFSPRSGTAGVTILAKGLRVTATGGIWNGTSLSLARTPVPDACWVEGIPGLAGPEMRRGAAGWRSALSAAPRVASAAHVTTSNAAQDPARQHCKRGSDLRGSFCPDAQPASAGRLAVLE